MALWQPTLAVLPGDPLAAHAVAGRRSLRHGFSVLVCEDDAALLRELRRALVDEHLEPLMAGIRERVHLGRRTLWGSLASGAAHALARAADSVPGPIVPMINDVLAALGVDDLVDMTVDPATGSLHIARRTCCLAFTLPEPKICTGCCIR
jgi:ferric iron reductase protein FhuF